MKTYKLTLLSCLLACFSFINAQQTYDIRFKLDNIDCEKNEVCYHVQIRSANGQNWALAGQNYRIFYDGSKATYKVGSGLSLLPPNDYSPFTLTTNVPNTDASAFNGLLPFDETLGFLNYSIDLMDLASGGIRFPADGSWVSTSLICFNMVDETIEDPTQCLNLIWARAGLTDTYATAFVEVSEWTGQNATINAETDIYDDLDENDGDDACISALCGVGNPTEISDAACSDGVDNDNDGLIDCNDPDCENTSPCIATEQQFYGIRLSLGSLDCETNQVCYNVELKSEGKTSFLLGEQNYRLFYDSELASFVQGISDMAQNTFTPFTLLENTEDVNASNQGDLPFDDNLGFLDYSIGLSGFEPSTFEVPTNRWVKTSTLCFNLAEGVIGDAASCFNVVWARDGITNGYKTTFVEINEFVSPTDSRPTSGMLYDDLNAEDGNSSCFTDSCTDFENSGTACGDGKDNDGDGLVDCADPDCEAISACNDNKAFIGDMVFEDLNGNGIRENSEQGINSITISIFADANQDGNPDSPNNPIATTVSATNFSNETQGNYGFSVPPGNYVLVASDLSGYSITRRNQGNDPAINSDYEPANARTATINLVANGNRADIDLGLYRFASISGIAFNDVNADGIAQAGENGLNNVIVNLYKDLNSDGNPDNINEIVATTTTAPLNGNAGRYSFQNLAPCPYVLQFKPGVGFSPTIKDAGSNDNVDSDIVAESGITMTVVLQSGQNISNIYAGYVAGTAVGDFVWNDADGDGVKDPSETGVNGITVRLFNSSGTLISNTVTVSHPETAAAGYYKFTDLSPGNYYIQLVLNNNLVSTIPNAIGDEEIDSDITDANGPNTSSTFTLTTGQVICDLDAGIYTGGSISGLIWQDKESGVAGVYEQGVDTPLENIRIKLLDDEGTILDEVNSNSTGQYTFSLLKAGSYRVMIVGPQNLSFVNPNAGNNDDIDSEVTNTNDGTTDLIFVGVGANILGINGGFQFGTLPVDLLSFTGYWNRDSDANILNWSTITEINNQAFEIERSINLKNGFDYIGVVEGNGNSTSLIDYEFHDNNISISGTYYYRLKQIDYNGDFEYSDVIAIEVSRIGSAYVKVIQNPVTEKIRLEMFSEDDVITEISLFDLNGKLMSSSQEKQYLLPIGKSTISVDTDHLNKGQYFLLVKMAEERFVKKIVKL
jgi:archaellum component FlaF (FlaF/FlaG flagellin family)